MSSIEMTTLNDIQLLQSSIDENLEKRVIVQLIDSPSNNEKNLKKAKSGLVRISNLKQLQRKDKKLRRDFKFWMPPSFQINEVCNDRTQQTRTESLEFNEMTHCIEYIKSCHNKRIILILSSFYARNKNVVSQFKRFPQIALLYCCVPEILFDNWLERWSFETQFFTPKILPRTVIQARVQDVDEASQLLLMQLFFTEIVLKLPRADEAKEDFLEFCRFTYENDSTYSKKIEYFKANYNENDAVNWYTRPDSFIFRIVCRACASFDFDTFFKIRFFLRDFYMQLKKSHQEQLTTLLQTDLLVHRGAKMSLEELSHLRTIGDLFVTRNFLSTTTEEDVACIFSGNGDQVNENKISVLISMHIDHEELAEKPIAFIGEISQISSENEVILSMGIVFRIVSCEEVNNDSIHLVKITMIRGKEEHAIEKKLNKINLLVLSAASSSPFVSMAIFLKSVQNSQYCEQYCQLMSNALKLLEPEVAQQLENMSTNNIQSELISNNVVNSTTNTLSNSSGELISHVPLQTKQNIVMTNETVQSGITDTSTTKYIAYTAQSFRILPKTLLPIIGVLIVITAVVVSICILLVPRKDSTAIVCPRPRITCSTNSFILNQSPNYQVEHLDLNCSQSLSNLTIIQTVQRTFNETHAQQYQTFWNDSTNMTYIVTATEIIYIWYSLPRMQIVEESFPHFIEAQFDYTNGSVRNTSDDTWQIWIQSICKDLLYIEGTF